MINIYDTANQMEQDLRKTSQYQELQTAYEALKADETAFKCFNEIHLGKEADGYETLQTLMQKEQSLSMMMDELSKIIFRPIQELYKD